MPELRLEELTASNIEAANGLTLKPGQREYLAPTTYQESEDQLDPAGSWPRVILDGDEVVGYVMGAFDGDATQEWLKSALWRIHVSAEAQGQGVGRFAVQALAEEARRRGFDRVTVVWATGEGSPESFFTSVGFSVVGETPYGEKLGALSL